MALGAKLCHAYCELWVFLHERPRLHHTSTYWPARTRVKPGTTVTFTNVGDVPHTATAFDKGKVGDWDTGALAKGESKEITFTKPGTYFYICTPHPWMYGQVIVE